MDKLFPKATESSRLAQYGFGVRKIKPSVRTDVGLDMTGSSPFADRRSDRWALIENIFLFDSPRTSGKRI